MSTRFYPGQTDYIAQLNAIDDQLQNAGPLTSSLGALGSNLNDRSSIFKWSGTDTNTDMIEVSLLRQAAGSGWNSAGWRIQQKVDATWMGYIQFSGSGNSQGFSIGAGSSTANPNSVPERLKIDSTGSVYLHGATYLGSGSANYFKLVGSAAGGSPSLTPAGSDTNISLLIGPKGAGSVVFNGGTGTQFSVNTTANAVNYIQAGGNTTGGIPYFTTESSTDTNVHMNLNTKGAGNFNFYTNSWGSTAFKVLGVSSAVNFIQVAPSVAGSGVGITAQGTDTNVDLNINGKGTGQLVTNSNFATTKNIYGTYTDNSGGINITATGATAARYPQVTVTNHSSSFGGHSVVELHRSKGTSAAPATVVANDILGGLNTWGHNGTAMQSATRVEGVAETTFSTTVTAGLKFSVTLAGSQSQGLYIAGDKTATFAGTVVAPNLKLTNTASSDVNTLDYYQEGSITPVMVGTTTAGTGTYTTQSGTYTRIGNRVMFDIVINITAHTGTGNAEINGLPFTVATVAQCNTRCSGLTFTGQLAAYVTGTKIVLEVTDNGSTALLPMFTSGFVRVSGNYQV